jgi:5,10-methylenetetrahydrofolate reductase
MKISYEMNPPKIVKNTNFDLDSLKQDLDKFRKRVSKLTSLVDSIHLTDSVLGIPRISSISAAQEVRRLHNLVKLRCSVRVRDRNLSAITQLVCDAIMIGVDGLLIVKGDKPERPSIDSGLRPSSVVKILNEQGFGDKIKLFLSVPCSPDLNKMQKKIDAEPYGFITQSISSLDQLQKIVDSVKSHGIKIMPCIMVPSPKNKESADMIDLDWSRYEKDTDSFVKQAHDMCGEVLVTSPNSFDDGINLLTRLSGGMN